MLKNWMESTKWTYHKELSFTSNWFCFSIRTSNQKLIWCLYRIPTCAYSYFKRWSFTSGAFSVINPTETENMLISYLNWLTFEIILLLSNFIKPVAFLVFFIMIVLTMQLSENYLFVSKINKLWIKVEVIEEAK